MVVKTGLVSVTFRKEEPETVIDWVREAGLEAIEWGGDVHVPAGNLMKARAVGARTRSNGLLIPTYGSYYRAGTLNAFEARRAFSEVLATAVALGARGIRVWANQIASEKASPDIWERTLADLSQIRDQAQKEGLELYLEYHNNTLNDRPAATRYLLSALNGPSGVKTFWQPLDELTFEENLQTLEAARPYLAHVHVFSDQGASQPLGSSQEQWLLYLPKLLDAGDKETASFRCLMIEFVKNNSKEAFLEDARTLKNWLELLDDRK